MNRLYRLIWNHSKHCWQVASERARGHVSQNGSTSGGSAVTADLITLDIHPLKTLTTLCLIALAWLSSAVYAAPAGGAVTTGSAGISQAGNTTTIQQNSQNVTINWNTFSSAANEAIIFNQPNSSAIALNRVTGSEASNLLGSLTANGQVFILNPNGILFGSGAQVNVGGLVASTLNISDSDFNSGNYTFANTTGTGNIINQGHITATTGGYVAMLGKQISNQGSIVTPEGTSLLAAGDNISLNLNNGSLLSYSVNQGTINALAENKQLIRANGGTVILTAQAANDIATATVNNTGVIEAQSLKQQGGRIVLEGGNVTSTGTLSVVGDVTADGGKITIDGRFVALGGSLNADGANGGSVTVASQGGLSLAERVHARGLSGDGGSVSYTAASRLVENSGSSTDVSGAQNGGAISVNAERIFSSGTYSATGDAGQGGRIDLTAAQDINLLSAHLDASGNTHGGLIRVGGAFQGGKSADPGTPSRDRFVTRWGDLPALRSAQKTFINDSSTLNVSASAGEGGTAIVWSDLQTTMLGHIAATGPVAGGAVEISSADELRHTNLLNVNIGPGGQLLLDPKNITIGNATASSWTYAAIMGLGYGSTPTNPEEFDYFGTAVAFNATGDRLAVGARGDDGAGTAVMNSGAVYLINFSDANFSGGALQATVGKGYTGGKNVDVAALETLDFFGAAVALNATGDRLAVGAFGDDGSGNVTSAAGAVHLFSFADTSFSGGTLQATLGKNYVGGKNLNVGNLEISDRFGASVALNAAGDRLAVGASEDEGGGSPVFNAGAVYLFSFTDTSFSGGTLQATIGKNYTGGKNIDMGGLESSDYFGASVALNAAGDRLAVGANFGDGAGNAVGNSGEVYLFSFTDTSFSGGTLTGTIGSGYSGGANIHVAGLEAGDLFGSSVALNAAGDRLAVGSPRDGGSGNVASNSGAAYLFNFSDTGFSGGTLAATLGRGYTGGGNVNVGALEAGDSFGASVALNAGGDRLAVGANFDNGSGNAGLDNGAVYLFIGPEGTSPISDGLYATRPGESILITATNISAQLNAGTAVTLQASNDITLNSAINATVGSGGHLTLQAGRSVLLNANITTNNGNVTLIANDRLANGVVDAQREAGNAMVIMAAGTSINAGSGNVVIELRDGAGKTHRDSSDIILRNITANTISAVNSGPTVISGSGVVLAAGSTLTATATSGDGIVLAGKTFTNQAGSAALATGGSRWLVWSGNPADDIRWGLVHNFKQYNASYGSSTVLGIGSGYLYTLAPVLTASLVVPDITAIVAKEYDGNASATLAASNYSLSGVVDNDVVTLNNPTAGSYNDKHAGAGKAVTVSGLAIASALADGNAGNATVYGYQLASTTASANIGSIVPRNLTLNATADSKTYDGSTYSSGTVNNSGLQTGDSLTTVSQVYDHKNAGTGSLNVATYTVNDGNSGNNYNVVTNTAAGTINQANLTLSTSNITKTYDGTTTATGNAIATSGTLFTGDSLSGGTYAYTNKNAGTAKTVTVSGITVNDGNSGNNYNVTYANNTNSTINKANLTLNATADSKTYDGTINSSGIVNSSGLQTGDSLTVTSQVYDNKNAGSRTLNVATYTVNDGNSGNNYNVVTNTASGSINQANLTLSTSDVTKTYDGTTTATGNAAVTGGTLFASDSLSGGTYAYTNKNAGNNNKTVTVSGITVNDGNSGNNYNVTYANNTNSTINKANLTLNATADSKTYDGTINSSGIVNSSGLQTGDSLTAVSQVYDQKNAGTRTLSVASYTLNDGNRGNNYNVVTNTAAGTISQANLTLSTSDVTKTYDGTTAATGSAIVTSGTLYDTVSGGTYAYTNKNAGTGKTVTVNGITINDGNGGNNYNVTYANNTNSTINQANLTLSTSNVTKTYDGTTAASGSAIVTSGTLYDTLSGGSYAYADKNVGTAKTVTVNGITVNDGNSGNNYNVTYANNTSSTINQATLTLNAVVDNKTYDGTTNSSGAVSSSGLQTGDSLTGISQAYDNKNAGSGKIISVAAGYIVNDGNSGNNYSVATNTAAGTINQATLTLSTSDVSKTYDGTTNAIGSAIVTSGTLYDTLSGGTYAYTDKNVGIAKTVTVSGVAVNDGNSGNNYNVSYASNTNSTINQATLTLNALTDIKTYDGTTISNGTVSSSGLQTGDTLTGIRQVYDNKNAGSGKTISVAAGYTVNDGNSGNNYNVVTNTAAGTINQASLTLSTSDVSKTYDGTTTATGNAIVSSGTLYDTLNGGTYAYTDKNAGTGKTVTVSGITVNDGNSGNNYNVTYANNINSTINKASLIITANNDSRTYDGHIYNGGNGVSYAGFVTGDSHLDLTGAMSYGGTSQGAKNMGSYIITPSGYASGNYMIAYDNGTLLITPSTVQAATLGGNTLVNAYDGVLQSGVGARMGERPVLPGSATGSPHQQITLNTSTLAQSGATQAITERIVGFGCVVQLPVDAPASSCAIGM